jgi:hypothetical protein
MDIREKIGKSNKIDEIFIRNTSSIILIILLPIIFFSPVLFSEYTFVFRDFYRYYYPFYYLKVELIKSGIFPLWNPYLFCGMPFFALIQTGVLYPPSIVLYLLPFDIGLKVFIIIHFIISGIFTYLFSRRLNMDILPALGAGITYTFSGYLLSVISLLNTLCTAAWLPVILYLYSLSIHKNSLFYIILTGLFIGIQILAGEPVIAYITISLIFIYGILCFDNLKQSICYFFIACLTGISTTLVQLLPFMELTLLSVRAHGVVYEEATLWSLSPVEVLTLIVPFFTDVMKVTRQEFILSIYFGIIPISMIGLYIFWGHRKIDRIGWFWIICFFISIIISFGNYLPLYKICYQYIPGFNMIRHSVKFIVLVTFSGAILAGYGLNCLPILRRKFIYIALSLVGICLILWYISVWKCQEWFLYQILYDQFYYCPLISIVLLLVSIIIITLKKRKPYFCLFGIIVCIAGDLLFHGAGLNLVISQRFYHEVPELVSILKHDKYTGVIRSIIEVNTEKNYKRDNTDVVHNVYAAKHMLFYNLGLLWKIFDAYGYEALTIRDYEKFIWHIRHENISRIYHLLNMMNIRYIIAKEDISNKRIKLSYVINDVNVYENLEYLPRVLFVPKVCIVADKREAFYRIMSSEFDPKKEVVIFEDIEQPVYESNITSSGYSAKIIDYQLNEILIHVDTDISGFVFLSDTYYPGWKAYIDGEEVKIYRANYIFRAVQVTPGTHEIKFIYSPYTFRIGMYTSILSFILISTGLWLGYRLKI